MPRSREDELYEEAFNRYSTAGTAGRGERDVSRLQSQVERSKGNLVNKGIEPPKEGPSLVSRFFDVLSRGQYASAGLVHGLVDKDKSTNPITEAWKGIRGKTKYSYSDVLKEDLGVKNKWVVGIGGFAGDVLLDPTTYIGAGLVKAAGKEVASKVIAKAAAEGAEHSDDVSKLVQAVAKGKGKTAKIAKKVGDEEVSNRVVSKMLEAKRLHEAGAPGAVTLNVMGRPVVSSVKAYKGVSKVGDVVKTYVPGAKGGIEWWNKAFRTASIFPGNTREVKSMFEGQSVAEFEESLGFLRQLNRKGKFTQQQGEVVARAIQDGTINDLPGKILPVGNAVEPGNLKDLAHRMQSMKQDLFDEGVELGLYKKSDWNENYLFHHYKDDPFASKKFKTFAEAEEAGHKPLKNIFEIMAMHLDKHATVRPQKLFYDSLVNEHGIKVAGNTDLAAKLEGMGYRKQTKGNWIPDDTYFHPEISKAINYMQRNINRHRPEETQKLLKMFDKVQGTYKFWVTTPNPGFHVRNLVGDTFNGWLDGVKDPRRYTDAGNILARKEKWATDIGGTKQGWKDIDRLYTQTGLRSGFSRVDIGSQFAPTGGLGVATRAGEALRKGSAYREDFGRMAHFVDAMKKYGKDATTENEVFEAAKKAAAKVRKFHFDYGDLTDFEKSVMKRTVPFYTWMRKNVPLQMEMLARNPGKYAAVGKGQQAIQQILGTHPDDGEVLPGKTSEVTPKWLQEMATVRLRGEGEGQHSIYWAPGLPFEDLFRFEGGKEDILRQALSQTTLALRIPAELGTGKSLFSGAPVSDWSDYFQQQVPLMRVVTESGRAEDLPARKQPPQFQPFGSAGPSISESTLNLLTGLGIRKVTPQRQLGELRRQKDPVDVLLEEARKEQRRALGLE